MTEQDARHYMRRRMGRAWLTSGRHIQTARCVACLANGDRCCKPAQFIDPIRGGMVCEEHKPI